MIPWPRRHSLAALATTAALVGGTPIAAAQVGPSPIPTQTTPAGEDKPKGPAEAAPADTAALPTTPMLPPPKSKRTKFELFELDGYFRFRTDWFKNFHLGHDSDPTLGGAPFRIPLSCQGIAGDPNPPCEDTLKSANIRMRLEPTINLSETAQVFLRVDVLDNVVLGSTPVGTFLDGTSPPTNIPIRAFSDSQVAPEAGRNSISDSIVVKHAWAQVVTAVGLFRFGRMPSHWGLGILANAGGYDPFHGTYDLDSDYGDTADRLLWGIPIPGTDLSAAVGMDWASTTPVAAQSDIWRNRYDGQPWDLEDADDVNQWLVVISRLDKPEEWKDKVERGDLALNYGTYFVYRTQDWDSNLSGFVLGDPPGDVQLVRRGAKAYIPDIWGRLAFKQFSAELEAVAVIGSIEELDDVGVTKPPDADEEDNFDIRQLGAVLKLGYRAMENKLNVGFEVGYASGDQWDNEPQGSTNVRDARALPAGDDLTISNFRFDFDYEVDLILFRELIGTVTNATYLKPTVSYAITDSITFAAQSIVSFANVPVATPGNSRLYGVEFDADLGYRGDLGRDQAFFAGISYGVLFPLGALDHPEELGYIGSNIGDASTAHTIQTRLMLRF